MIRSRKSFMGARIFTEARKPPAFTTLIPCRISIFRRSLPGRSERITFVNDLNLGRPNLRKTPLQHSRLISQRRSWLLMSNGSSSGTPIDSSWQNAETREISDEKPYRVLMVCLGNICRSPAAEAVLRAKASHRGLFVETDSCGTGGGARNWYKENGFSYHEGDEADERMGLVASQRGYQLTSRSRPLRPSDMTRFDLILGMDNSNIQAIDTAFRYWQQTGRMDTDSPPPRIVMLSEFSNDKKYVGKAVPDPYYGDGRGFENALDMIEAACDGILDAVSENKI